MLKQSPKSGETTAATRELAADSDALRGLVQQFKIDANEAQTDYRAAWSPADIRQAAQ
jgi:hypothetical protein